jgi:hypothetical protein
LKRIQAELVVRRGPPWWLWALVLAGAVAAAGMHWQTRQLMAQRLVEQQQAEQQAREAAEAYARAAQAPAPFAADLAEIRKLRSVQWPQLLAALEVTPRGDVQISSLDIDVVQRRASISVTAPSLKTIVDYTQELQRGAPDGEAAWRFSIGRVTERAGGGLSASIEGSWGK